MRSLPRFCLLGAFVAAGVAGHSPVWAQVAPRCGDRQQVLDLLAKKYGEQRVAFGVTSDGGLIEVLKSSSPTRADSWSIVITLGGGKTCLLAAGDGWRAVVPNNNDPDT